jgi:hypothetical protein
LLAAGKVHHVAIVACMRKLVVILNAWVRDAIRQTPKFQQRRVDKTDTCYSPNPRLTTTTEARNATNSTLRLALMARHTTAANSGGNPVVWM